MSNKLLPQDIEVLNKIANRLFHKEWNALTENNELYSASRIELAVVLARQETEKRKHNVCQLCENKKEEGTICLSCFREKIGDAIKAENQRCLKKIDAFIGEFVPTGNLVEAKLDDGTEVALPKASRLQQGMHFACCILKKRLQENGKND